MQNNFVTNPDECIKKLELMNEFYGVKDYLMSIFGSFRGAKWIDYPVLNKEVYLLIEKEKVEFCVLEDEKQYYGKGWMLATKD